MVRVIHGYPVVAGSVRGELIISSEPLSFWGGYDYLSGEIIDRRHPLSGIVASGKILGVPYSRGSSTTTAVLLEAMRAGTAPAALLSTGVDSFFALASIVADEMDFGMIPILAVEIAEYDGLQSGDWIEVHEDGRIVVEESRSAGRA